MKNRKKRLLFHVNSTCVFVLYRKNSERIGVKNLAIGRLVGPEKYEKRYFSVIKRFRHYDV
jgi:hypothetical protein